MEFGKKLGKKKKKKKEIEKIGRLLKVTANGVDIPVITIQVGGGREDGIAQLKLGTREPVEQLHFQNIDFVIETTLKKLKISAEFSTAEKEKSFYLYTFLLTDYKEFFA